VKLFFAYDYALSGTESVLLAVAGALRNRGHIVDCLAVGKDGAAIPPGLDRSLSGYDAVHFWNIRPASHFHDQIVPPFGVTIHGFIAGHEETYIRELRRLAPTWIHVMDSYSRQYLGQRDLYSFQTPQCIRIEGWERMSLPATFSVGYLGGDSEGFKRFPVIEAAARLSGCPCAGHNASDRWLSRQEVRALYARTSVYVNAAFGACGPVPAQEALLCGRPILTTPITTMLEVVRPGIDGEFFDGSAEDAARRISEIRQGIDRYCRAPLILHDPGVVADLFCEEVARRL